MGRSLGIRVGQELIAKNRLPDDVLPTDIGDIVQSTCLAHDIGNPPFGHTGEEAIRHWFENDGEEYLKNLSVSEAFDLTHFEGNAQGLRVLTSSEYHPYDGGMRLTYATLAAFIKYPWTAPPSSEGKRPKDNKFGIFQSELATFAEVAEATGLNKRGDDWYSRHPLAYLMEASDDICYGLLDLEDGLEMGILKWDEIFQILRPMLDPSEIDNLVKSIAEVGDGRKPPLLRGKVISAFVDSAATAFIQNEVLLLKGEEADLISLCDANVREAVRSAKDMAKTKVFAHPRKIELEIGAYNAIATLLEVMCCAAIEFVDNPAGLSFRSKRVIDLIGPNTFHPLIRGASDSSNSSHYLALMRVIDFVSGMTDNYATYLSRQFNGLGESR